MSRRAASTGTRDRSGAATDHPPWPTVTEERVAPPGEHRRAWGAISYEERYREQREAFLRIARELANASSPDDVQISHIVSEAGVSRRTFYEHFPTKEACFAEIVRVSAQPIVADFIEVAEKALASGPTATYRALIKAWAALLGGDEPRFSRQLALRMWTDGLRPGSPYSDALSRIVGLVTDVFVVAAQRLATPLPEPLLQVAARQQVLGLFGSALRYADHGFPAAELDRIATVIVVGLGFPPETPGRSVKRQLLRAR